MKKEKKERERKKEQKLVWLSTSKEVVAGGLRTLSHFLLNNVFDNESERLLN